MQNLGNFLDKFKKIFSGAKFQKDAILSIINSTAKIQLDEKDIEVKDFKITLKTSPGVKSVIFMRKQKILAELKNALGNEAPIDIR
jgi:cell division protein FtsX